MGYMALLQIKITQSKNHPNTIVDHVFMWDAAVPNNVFNRSKMPNNQVDRWDYRRKALNATKTVTILYSINDNILGPMIEGPENPAHIEDIDKAKPPRDLIEDYS